MIHLGGGLWQEQVLAMGRGRGSELEVGLGLESGQELVAELADTGCLASKPGRAALEPELEQEQEQGQELEQEQE